MKHYSILYDNVSIPQYVVFVKGVFRRNNKAVLKIQRKLNFSLFEKGRSYPKRSARKTRRAAGTTMPTALALVSSLFPLTDFPKAN